ncbi:MAG TPA: single-stranded DNA-binding protein [Candidatus Sulfotelmatobacter sp.]|nr:single-stranded DNA-binding protein [Candidatus Sulfotelmatobacter sp.]
MLREIVFTLSVTGRIVREAEVQTAGNVTLARTTIASDRSRKKTAKADLLDAVGFGNVAGQLTALAKGEFVRITRTVRTWSYDDTSGTRRKSAQIVPARSSATRRRQPRKQRLRPVDSRSVRVAGSLPRHPHCRADAAPPAPR